LLEGRYSEVKNALMTKLAIFVEGLTEQLFIDRLITEIAGAKHVRIEKRKARGGQCGARKMTLIDAVAPNNAHKYFVLIVDCGSDNRVASDLREQYDSLCRSGYSAIIGLRDVYPVDRADIAKLAAGLRYKVKTKPVDPLFVLAVMEIEAWFLAEHTHFQRIDPALAMENIKQAVGFDPSVDDMEQRARPAQDLDTIYRIVGSSYVKRRETLQRTVQVLDVIRFYLDLTNRLPSLRDLITAIDQFLA
jgi:hypothetical protein